MGLACALIILSVALGKILLFTFLSFCSLGGDGSKLDTQPSKPAYELVVDLSSIYRNIRYNH